MKEGVAMWKRCLVHLDLFIICLQSKAAGLHAVCCAGLRVDHCPGSLFERQQGCQHSLKRALDGGYLSATRPPNWLCSSEGQ